MNDSDRLQQRWLALSGRLGLARSAALGRELIERYREPQRVFHTAEHLCAVLDTLDCLRADDRLHLAAWFHDAVYRPAARDNEVRSAALARQRLADLGMVKTDIDFVCAAILATAGHASDDPALAPLLDADLAILGAEPARYRRYAEQIRGEYPALPALLYRSGRRRFLRSMLDRPAIFRSDEARARFERQARDNLAAELCA